MSITTFLDGIIAKLGSPAPTFEIGVKSWQNVIADNAVLPIIFLDEPIKSEDVIKSNRIIEEKYKLILYFFDKSQLDLTALQQNVIAENMRTLRREFLLELSKDEKVKLISSLSTENVFNALDANVTGCRLFLDLTLYPDEKVC